MNLKAIEAKQKSILSKVFRYPEGIMNRSEWINLKKKQGCAVRECLKSKTMYSRTKFNRMNWDQQKEYEIRLETKVPCYELVNLDNSFHDITKTEFDYFNSI